MKYILADFEWDFQHVPDLHGTINVILGAGALILDENFEIIDKYSSLIKPDFKLKPSGRFKKLTGLTKDEIMQNGIDFYDAVEDFTDIVEGLQDDVCFLFWGSSDIVALTENCCFLQRMDDVPFVDRYVDILSYVCSKRKIKGGMTPSLVECYENLCGSAESFNAHDALSDCLMSLGCLKAVYEEGDFESRTVECDEDYYKLRLFTSRINLLNSKGSMPLCKQNTERALREFLITEYTGLQVRCLYCGKSCAVSSDWKPNVIKAKTVSALVTCPHCEKLQYFTISASSFGTPPYFKARLSKPVKKAKNGKK